MNAFSGALGDGCGAWGGVLSEDFPLHLAGFQAGSLVAGYRLEAQVGAGGMAVVFRARDERLGRPVALKILSSALAADEGFRRRFIAESRAAATVDDPHIIPVYEAGESGGVLFIAMRFVKGGDLRGVLEREGALAPGRVAAFISPVASALDAAHAAGLVHRDVKPANILVDARPDRPDHVYLSDFGVSKGAVSSVLTGTGQFLGTPDYSAPEQVQGLAVDGRTDQYALACVVFQMLTGALPFERDQGLAVLLAHLNTPPPSLGSRRPGLPGAVDQVLARALAKVPEKRYGSCRDFADALREALGLPPYNARGFGSAPDQLQPGITARPEVSTSVVGGTGEAALLAGPAAAATIDSVPADEPGAPVSAIIVTRPGSRADDDGGAVSPTATAVAEQGIPVTAKAASQPTETPGTAGGSGKSAREPDRLTADADGPVMTVWIRQHRLLGVALACAVLAVAGVVSFVLASSPRHSNVSTLIEASLGNGSAHLMAFSSSGATLATGNGDGSDGSVYLWNVATKRQTTTLSDLQSGVTAVAFSPDDMTLAAGGTNGSTYLWNVATQSQIATLPDPNSQYVYSVAFSPDGKTLATADGNGSTYLWNVATKALVVTLTAPSRGATTSVAFNPDGMMLASTRSGSVYLWHVTADR
jgi:serine/threonine protein kinase